MRNLFASCLTLCVALSGLASQLAAEDKPNETALTLFARASLTTKEVAEISAALDEVGLTAQLLIDLETASGFVPWEDSAAAATVGVDSKKNDAV